MLGPCPRISAAGPIMSSFTSQVLLSTETMTLRDVHCSGTCRHRSAEECAASTQLVFPYRGLYLRTVTQANEGCDLDFLVGQSAPVRAGITHG